LKFIDSLRQRFSSIHFPFWTIPLALLVFMLAAFGLLIPRSGFYWDDWTQLLVARIDDLSTYWAYFSSDRPTSAWTHILFVPLLGMKTIHWQVFTLVLRWLTVLGMWWSLGLIWPQQKRIITTAAFLFAVYPAFRQQPTAVAYHQHWLQFALYFASLGCMVLAIRRKRFVWWWMVLSLVLEALQLSITEFYAGIELIRPLILWMVLSQEKKQTLRLRKSIVNWLPYSLILIGYSSWRLFFSGIEKHPAKLLFLLREDPLAALGELFRLASLDELYITLTSWSKTLDLNLELAVQPVVLLSWLLSVLTTLGLWLYFQYLPESPVTAKHTRSEMLLLGAAVTLVGPMPIWLTGGRILAENDFHADRFTMASMWGISLVLVVFIEYIVQNWRRTALIISILIGLSVGLHLRIANDYRWIWTNQQRFYWQLLWRAPYLHPGTALVAEETFLAHQELFSTSSAINHLYKQPADADTLAYWMYKLIPAYEEIAPEQEIHFNTVHRIFSFQGTLNESLVIQYKPEVSGCLWVLNEDDVLNPDVTPLMQQAAVHTNMNRIGINKDEDPAYPPVEMIGTEPVREWCYIFQKAELAVQQGDWQQAYALAIQAQDMGYVPGEGVSNHAREWIPLLRAYLHQAEPDVAGRISEQLIQFDKKMQPMLCSVWQEFSLQPEVSPWLERMQCLADNE
jgi:hypothetical protein